MFPACACISIKPGMTHFRAASTTKAPEGTGILAEVPTCSMLSPRITMNTVGSFSSRSHVHQGRVYYGSRGDRGGSIGRRLCPAARGSHQDKKNRQQPKIHDFPPCDR